MRYLKGLLEFMLFSTDKWRGVPPPLLCIILGVLLQTVAAKPQSLPFSDSSYLRVDNYKLRDKFNYINNSATSEFEPFINFGSAMDLSNIVSKLEQTKYFGVDKFWKRFKHDGIDDPGHIPLNESNFLITLKRYSRSIMDGGFPYIPRFMMEFFGDGEKARKLPQGATVVRSYPVVSIEKIRSTIEEEEDLNAVQKRGEAALDGQKMRFKQKTNFGVKFKSDKLHKINSSPDFRKHISKSRQKKVKNNLVQLLNNSDSERNLNVNSSWPQLSLNASNVVNLKRAEYNVKNDVSTKETYKMFFDLTFPPAEEIHSAVLRIYSRTRRKNYDFSGVDRRLRVYIKKQITKDEIQRHLIIEKDVYLMKNSWIDLDISPAAHYFKKNQSPYYVEVEVAAEFFCVGGQGNLELVLDFESSLRPYLLIYATSYKAIVKEAKENVSHRVLRSVNSAEFEEEETNMIWEGDSAPLAGLPQNLLKGKKLGRKARRRRAKNACKRKPLTVEFKEIDWDQWIIAPQTYEAYQCSGKCYYPLPSHLSPTKHAVIQNLIHSKQPESTPRACCVPTKLGPISLLYLEANVPTYDYDYGEMVVLECGCR